jgi:hypothetical protein
LCPLVGGFLFSWLKIGGPLEKESLTKEEKDIYDANFKTLKK